MTFLLLFPLSQPAVHVQGQEPLTASMLAAAPPQEQKQMLGKVQQQLCVTTFTVLTIAFQLETFSGGSDNTTINCTLHILYMTLGI